MASLNEDFLREHIARMNELNTPGRSFVQELNPKIAAIVKKLQENPSFISKVELFISTIPTEILKPNDNSQLMS
jgi:hypothetical protein